MIPTMKMVTKLQIDRKAKIILLFPPGKATSTAYRTRDTSGCAGFTGSK
jgi:hypothetical protein